MDWLLALLAFAPLMAVLSTIVTISVEFLHKLLQLRRHGLEESLRALHDNVVAPLEAGERPTETTLAKNGRSKEAAKFANDVTKNPSFGGGGRLWWPSNWSGLNLFQRRFERLTKRQFAEQLAQTDFGRRLRSSDRSVVRTTLAHAAYQFDRYGVAQTGFFRRRAKVLSGLAAFVFVFFSNLDAIRLYVHFATDDVALRTAVERLDSEQFTQMIAIDIVGEQDFQTARNALISLSGQRNLPMGQNYFPFCKSSQILADPNLSDAFLITDDRCGEFVADDIQLFGHVIRGSAPLAQAGYSIAASPAEGFKWFLSLIATTGLLALGAPFWFEVFNRVAAMAGSAYGLPRRRSNEIELDSSHEARAAVGGSVRKGEDPGLDELTDAFLIAAGVVEVPPGGLLPIGRRLGDASSMTANSPGGPDIEAEG